MNHVKFINKDNLRIARENMGLDVLTASKKITTSQKNLVAEWESGDSLPTWSQVAKLAKAYNIPELLFFAKDKITKNKVIPDHRVGEHKENDEQVQKLINVVITRQRWLEDKLKEEGFTKNPLQGKGKAIGKPKELADLIARDLMISLEEIKSITGVGARKEVLNYLIKKAEEKGVFVGKTISYHKLRVDDMRGLFVSNDYCPFIIINRTDAASAQIFSFVHELAHLFRKTDSISNSLDFRAAENKDNAEEVFCNKVAAELLLPRNEFAKEFYNKADIQNISETYKASEIFVFYRLKELGKIKREIQSSLEKEILTETARNVLEKTMREKEKKGGNFINAMRDSNGALFNRIVAQSYSENRIGYVEASNLLRFSAEKI